LRGSINPRPNAGHQYLDTRLARAKVELASDLTPMLILVLVLVAVLVRA